MIEVLRSTTWDKSAWAAALLGAIAFPFVVRDSYLTHVAALFLMYAILAMGLSVVVAYAGLLDLGYVAFFAVGAYFYAVLNTSEHMPFLLALPLAAVLAAGVGVVLGFPTLRVRGDYLALVTLAFGEMVRQVLQNWTTVTGGPKGIPGVRGPQLAMLHLEAPWQYFLLVLFCAAGAVLTLKRIGQSPVARVWEALREEETAAKSCGIDSTKWFLLAFAIGASFAGVVGVLFAAVQRFVSPETFVLDESVLVLSIVVLSRGKSLPRIFVAAAIFYGLPELLRPIHEYRTLVFGALLVLFTVVDFKIVTGRGRSARRKNPEASVLTSGRPRGPAPALGDPWTAAPLGFDPPRQGREPCSFLRVHEVEKDFSGLRALAGVTMDISCAGRIIALVGPNGAGKTTLFDCISGLTQVDHGEIELAPIGRLTNRPPHSVARAGVGRTFQRGRLFGSMTVAENVEVGAYCGMRVPVVASLLPGLSLRRFREACQQRVLQALRLTALGAYAATRVTELPIGIRRKVEIARALAMQPTILLLDEAASGLNDAEKRELAPVLRRLASEHGLPIILVEHDMSFVLSVADHMVVLDSGQVIAEGEPADVVRQQHVINCYLGVDGGRLAVGA